MVTATQNGTRKLNQNGRTSRTTAAVGEHQSKRRGVQRKQVTAWIKPEDRKLLQIVADSRERTVSAVAGELLGEALRDAQAQPDVQNVRFTESEFDYVRKCAFELGMTPEEFIRRMIFAPEKQAVNATSNGVQHAAEPLRLTPAAETTVNSEAHSQPYECDHPIGDTYIELRRIDKHIRKALERLQRLNHRGIDGIYYYARGRHQDANQRDFKMIRTAFSALMGNIQIAKESADDAFEELCSIEDNSHVAASMVDAFPMKGRK